MGVGEAPGKRRLTWHTLSGWLALLSTIECGVSLGLIIGDGDVDRALAAAAVAIALAWLGRWAELRYRITLAGMTLRMGEETLTFMRQLADSGNIDPREARVAIMETEARVAAFRADFEAMRPR